MKIKKKREEERGKKMKKIGRHRKREGTGKTPKEEEEEKLGGPGWEGLGGRNIIVDVCRVFTFHVYLFAEVGSLSPVWEGGEEGRRFENFKEPTQKGEGDKRD